MTWWSSPGRPHSTPPSPNWSPRWRQFGVGWPIEEMSLPPDPPPRLLLVGGRVRRARDPGRPRTDPCLPGDPVESFRRPVPILSLLLSVHLRGGRKVRLAPRKLDGLAPGGSLPPVRQGRLRPSPLIRSRRPEQ